MMSRASLDVKHSGGSVATTPTAGSGGGVAATPTSGGSGGAGHNTQNTLANAAAAAKDAASLNEQLTREVAEYLTLHRACYLGRTKVVEQLLDAGGNADSFEGVSGLSCLMLAASGGHTKACAAILAKGRANVNLQAAHNGGLTALHHAAANDHGETVALLLDHKANPNIEDDAGNTAVNVAARNGHVQVLELLAERGANLDHANKKLSTPLLGAALNGRTAVLDLLCRQPANAINLNAADARGNTALHVAAKLGYARVLRQLLKSGARTDAVNLDGEKPDQCALTDAIAKLIRAGS